jgi:hypothetical protein
VQLLQLAARHPEIREVGGEALGVGPAAAYQAANLISDREIPFPLLLDPDHLLAEAIQLGRQPLYRFVFHLKGWWRWVRTAWRGRQGAITGAYWEVPAIVVVDSQARVVWAHRGRFLGDYPPIDETMRHLRKAISAAG